MPGLYCFGSFIFILIALAFVLPAQGINNTSKKISPKAGFVGVLFFFVVALLFLVISFVKLLS